MLNTYQELTLETFSISAHFVIALIRPRSPKEAQLSSVITELSVVREIAILRLCTNLHFGNATVMTKKTRFRENNRTSLRNCHSDLSFFNRQL